MKTKKIVLLGLILASIGSLSYADRVQSVEERRSATDVEAGTTGTTSDTTSSLSITDADLSTYTGNALTFYNNTQWFQSQPYNTYTVDWSSETGQKLVVTSTADTYSDTILGSDYNYNTETEEKAYADLTLTGSLIVGSAGNAGTTVFNVASDMDVYAPESDGSYTGDAVYLIGKGQLNITGGTTNVYGDLTADFGTTVNDGNASATLISVSTGATLNVDGDVYSEYNMTIDGSMYVDGTASFGAAGAGGDYAYSGTNFSYNALTNISGNLTVVGDASFAGLTTFEDGSKIILESDASFSGTTTFAEGSSTSIAGAASFAGTSTIDGTVTIESTGSLALSGATISGDGTLSIGGSATITGVNSLDVDLSISENGTIEITDATITGNSKLTISDNVTLSGSNVFGIELEMISVVTIDAENSFGLSGATLTGTGGFEILGTSTFTGDNALGAGTTVTTAEGTTTTINGASFTGDGSVVVNGDLIFTGSNTISDDTLDISKATSITLSGATITGDSTLNLVASTTTLTGANVLGINTYIDAIASYDATTGDPVYNTVYLGTSGTGSLTVNNGATVTVDGNVSLSPSGSTASTVDLYVTDNSTLSISGNFSNSSYNANDKPTVTIDSGSTLDVGGNAVLRGNVTLSGTLNVDGTLSFYRVNGTTGIDNISSTLTLNSGAAITGTNTIYVGNVNNGANSLGLVLAGDYTSTDSALAGKTLSFYYDGADISIELYASFAEGTTGNISLGSFEFNESSTLVNVDFTNLSADTSTVIIEGIENNANTAVKISLDGFAEGLLEIYDDSDVMIFKGTDFETGITLTVSTSSGSETTVTIDLGDTDDLDFEETLAALNNSIISAVVPEPSTYAMIFGALALGLAMYRRRK